MGLWGVKSSSPGTRAGQIIVEGWRALGAEHREAIASILLALLPALAAQGEKAGQALPMAQIGATLKRAFATAWTGIFDRKALFHDLDNYFTRSPDAQDLRDFVAQLAAKRSEAA